MATLAASGGDVTRDDATMHALYLTDCQGNVHVFLFFIMTNTEIKTITYEIFYGVSRIDRATSHSEQVSSPWAALGASQAYGFGEKYGLTVHLRPIVVIQNNGGITLAQRPQARLDYHALGASHLGASQLTLQICVAQPTGLGSRYSTNRNTMQAAPSFPPLSR